MPRALASRLVFMPLVAALGTSACGRSSDAIPDAPADIDHQLRVWAVQLYVPSKSEWFTTLLGYYGRADFDAFGLLVEPEACAFTDVNPTPVVSDFTDRIEIALGSQGPWTLAQTPMGWLEPRTAVPLGQIMPPGTLVSLASSTSTEIPSLETAAPNAPVVLEPIADATIAREPIQFRWDPGAEDYIYLALSFYDAGGSFLMVEDCLFADDGSADIDPWKYVPPTAREAVFRVRYEHSDVQQVGVTQYGIYARQMSLVTVSVAP